MTEAINFAVAILTLASAILATLYVFARDAAPRPQQQSYRGIAHGTSNKEPAAGTGYDQDTSSQFFAPRLTRPPAPADQT